MSLLTAHATTPDSTRLLTVPPPHPPPRRTSRRPFSELSKWLDLLTTILGAPAAVPPTLWSQPFADDPKAMITAILKQVEARIPLLDMDMVECADAPDDLDFLLYIPIFPSGFDTCNGETFEAYGPATALLAHLDGFDVPDLLWCPTPQSVPDALTLAPLLPALDALPAPLNGIAVIVAMLHHSTGTLVLDACPNCYNLTLDDRVAWTDANLTWLEQDAALATRIRERAFALETWVADNPIPHLKHIWSTILRLHRAHLAAPPVYQGPFTISAEDFVAGNLPLRPRTLAQLWAEIPAPNDQQEEPDGRRAL